MITNCPRCNGLAEYDAHQAGQQVTCPHCDGQIHLPGQTVAPPPLAEDFRIDKRPRLRPVSRIDPGWARVFSFAVPGLGQVYLGGLWNMLCGMCIMLMALFFWQIVGGLIGYALLFVVWSLALVGTHFQAEAATRK